MPKANGHYQEFYFQEGDVIAPGYESPLRRRSDPASPSTYRKTIETDFARLPDGRLIDLVTTGGPQPELAWVAWREGEYTLATKVECEGAVYVPPRLLKDMETAVRLPAAVGPLLTARELLGEIEGLVRTFIDLQDKSAFLISLFALSTFFFDRLSLAPYLVICGPPGSGKSTLLRLLRCITRRGLHAGGISAASLYRLTDQLSPTLLLDESDFSGDRPSREILRLLRNGDRPGADIYVAGRRFKVFGPKVICSRRLVPDAALASRAMCVTMLPTEVNFPTLDFEQEERIANSLQPKLERFRLEHYHNMRASQDVAFARLTPRTRQIGKVLAAPIADEPELLQHLTSCLQTQDGGARLDRQGEPEWAVAAGLFAVCHQPHGSRLFIGNLAGEVGRILADIGEPPLSAKAVGVIARSSIGAETVRVGRGYYLQLTPACRRQIHQLAQRMGISKGDILDPMSVAAGYGGPPCEMCSEFGLNTTSDGTELRCIDLLPGARKRKRLFDPDSLDP